METFGQVLSSSLLLVSRAVKEVSSWSELRKTDEDVSYLYPLEDVEGVRIRSHPLCMDHQLLWIFSWGDLVLKFWISIPLLEEASSSPQSSFWGTCHISHHLITSSHPSTSWTRTRLSTTTSLTIPTSYISFQRFASDDQEILIGAFSSESFPISMQD